MFLNPLLTYNAVVPYYFLVWYNTGAVYESLVNAVVPYYFLVWYNIETSRTIEIVAVVPYYFLVWYNIPIKDESMIPL